MIPRTSPLRPLVIVAWLFGWAAVAAGGFAGQARAHDQDQAAPALGEAPELSALYADARARLAARDFDGANARLRAILLAQPGARGARWELVRALSGAGRIEAALYHLDQLIEGARTSEERAMFERARRQLLARRPYGFTFGFSIQPSTNINRATLNTDAPVFGGLTGTIDNTGEAGVGLSATLGAYRRFELGERQLLTLSTEIGATAFDRPEYNRGYLSGAATLARRLESGRLVLRADAYRGLYRDSDENSSIVGLSAERLIFAEGARYAIGARLSQQWYDRPQKAKIYDNTKIRLSGSVRVPLGERTAASAGLDLTRSNAEDNRFSYLGLRAMLGLERGWTSGWGLGMEVTLEDRPYDRVFGGPYTEPRHDRIYGLEMTVSNSRLVLSGFAPRLRCRLSRSESNVVFYDNVDVEECALSLTRAF